MLRPRTGVIILTESADAKAARARQCSARGAAQEPRWTGRTRYAEASMKTQWKKSGR